MTDGTQEQEGTFPSCFVVKNLYRSSNKAGFFVFAYCETNPDLAYFPII